MAGFKVTVKENIDPHMLDGAVDRAQGILAQQLKKDTEQFVPALTSSLSIRTRVQENIVVYPGPYARYLYHGKLMVDPETGSPFAPLGKHKVITTRDLDIKKTTNPKAQARWFEASKKLNMKKWERVFKKVVLEK